MAIWPLTSKIGRTNLEGNSGEVENDGLAETPWRWQNDEGKSSWFNFDEILQLFFNFLVFIS